MFNKEKEKEYARKYRKAHRLELARYQRGYRAAHKLERAIYQREYRQIHKLEAVERHRSYHQIHRSERLEYMREYRKAHKASIAEKDKQNKLQLKTEVLTHYGNDECACVKCGFANIGALSIDHINGNGNKHKASEGIGSNLYIWLKKHNFPKGYQTLCMNCQFLKRVENSEYSNRGRM